MEITKEFLQAQLSEARNQERVHFANFHRAQAVMQMIEVLILKIDAPVEVAEEHPNTQE